MELTQIQWQNLGQKIPFQWTNPIGIWSDPSNQIVHSWLPWQVAQIANTSEWQRILRPVSKTSPVMVNWQLVSWPMPINRWDTISAGKNNDLILWVHAPWVALSPQQIWKHLSSLNLSNDQISEITNKIFDIKVNKAIYKPIIIAWSILFLLWVWVFYAFLKVSDLNTKLSSVSLELDRKIANANSTIQDFESILWITISWWDYECDSEFEECDNDYTQTQSVDQRITDINSKISDVLKKLNDVWKQFNSIKSDLVKTIDNAVWWSWIQVLQNAIVSDLQQWSLSDFQKKIDEMVKNFSLLDNALWDQVDLMKSDIKSFTDYKDDLKSLKDIKIYMASYDWDRAVLDKNIKLIQEDIKTINSWLNDLKKNDANLDSSIKNLSDKLSILENRVKELQK